MTSHAPAVSSKERLTQLFPKVRPPSPSQLLSKAKEGQVASLQPVPTAAPVPRRPFPQPVEEEEEDIMLDLDLNPGRSQCPKHARLLLTLVLICAMQIYKHTL
jgi:hypothetical protein